MKGELWCFPRSRELETAATKSSHQIFQKRKKEENNQAQNQAPPHKKYQEGYKILKINVIR